MTSPPVPPQAIAAAADAIWDAHANTIGSVRADKGRWCNALARAALEAAAPHLAAAERERCAQLALSEAAKAARSRTAGSRAAAALRRFAALLREAQPAEKSAP